MNAQHTPGPWKLETDEKRYDDASLVIYDSDGNALMGNAPYYPWVPDNKSDWLLIAAAPELLEALQGLIPVTFTGNPTRAEEVAHWTREKELGNGNAAAVLAAYAAIAKATGSAS